MSKQQALVVFCPSKKQYDDATDLSLRLNGVTSTTNDMNFKKRKTCARQDGDQEDSIRAKKLKKFKFYTKEEGAEEKYKGVCTKLKLYDDPWKVKKVLRQSDVFCPFKKQAIDLTLRLDTNASNNMNFKNRKKRKMCTYEDCDRENSIWAKKLEKFRFYTKEEEAEEKYKGVCTKLKLYDDPWKIKKVLQESDVNHTCRLMISKRLVEQHIVKVWEKAGRLENVRGLHDKDGISVKVWDCDREKEYVLTMKQHIGSSECYVLLTNWRRQFVSERGLTKGDEIGLFWCNFSGRFFFSVLARAPGQPVYYLEGF